MSIFDKYGSFVFPNNGNATSEEAQKEEKEHQEQSLELMHMYQRYHGIIKGKQYALRGSVLSCQYGTKYARLDCIEDYGIMRSALPVFTIRDCLYENVHNFGSCLCPENLYKERLPMTAASDEKGKAAKKAPGNVFAHICVPLVDEENGWKQVDEKVLIEVNAQGYAPMLLDDAVLVCQYGGIIFVREVPDVEEKQKKRGNRIDHLSSEYMKWFYQAEGTQFYPYIDPADNDDAKEAKTVTISPGITFNINGLHWDLLKKHFSWSDEDIRNIINHLFESGGKYIDYKKYSIEKYKIEEAFNELADEYFQLVNSAITSYENEDEEADTNYSQQQLEAMFDFAYNSGLSDADIDNPSKIIYYYLRYRKEGKQILEKAVDKVKEYNNANNRRRINQMNLFFYGDYYFYETKEDGFTVIKGKLGF